MIYASPYITTTSQIDKNRTQMGQEQNTKGTRIKRKSWVPKPTVNRRTSKTDT